MATNVQIDGAWTLQQTNTMLAGRMHDMGLFIPGASGDPTTIRSGVLTRTTLGGVVQDYLVKSRTDVGSLKVDVLPGNAIINRTGQGPYMVYNASPRTPTLSASSSSNPRIDVIILRHYDVTGLADTNPNSAGVNAAYVEVVTGTPAASPVAPTPSPAGTFTILAQVLVPTNAVNSTSLTVTDVRTSTSLAGMARIMLPGDSATMTAPTAFSDGERRWVITAGGSDLREDVWAAGKWQPQFLSRGRGYARYYRNAALTGISNATEFKQQLDASSDTCPEITAAAGGGYPTNTDFTFNLAGRWHVRSTMRFVNPGGLSGSGMYMEARIAAASGSGTNVWDLSSTNVPANAGASMTNKTEAVVDAVVGDTISVYYKQGTGVSLSLDVGAPAYNRIELRYMGP